ncbi:MAG TPA: hypothetical protein VGB85_18320 [Nannocystis sp.]
MRETASVTEPPSVALAPTCAPPPAAALALIADAPCPWILVSGDRSEMALRATDMVAPRALVVVPPEACGDRCSFTGASTALGPVVLATRHDPASELADAAFIGAALGGGTLRFTPLWYGASAHGDSTDLGPSYALVPWVCEEALVLAIGGRLPGARAEEPARALAAAAGVYAIADDELRRTDQAMPALTGCTRVPLELP